MVKHDCVWRPTPWGDTSKWCVVRYIPKQHSAVIAAGKYGFAATFPTKEEAQACADKLNLKIYPSPVAARDLPPKENSCDDPT